MQFQARKTYEKWIVNNKPKLDLIEKHKQGASLRNLAEEFKVGKITASDIIKSEKTMQD